MEWKILFETFTGKVKELASFNTYEEAKEYKATRRAKDRKYIIIERVPSTN